MAIKNIYKKTNFKSGFILLWRSLTFNYLIKKQYENANKKNPLMASFTNDTIGTFLDVDGSFEQDQLKLILSLLETLNLELNLKTFVDVGANIGLHSIFFNQIFKEIYAFEAHPKTYQILKFNISEYKNIHSFNFGIGSKEDVLKLHSNRHNLGGSSFVYDQKSGLHYNVKIKKLDQFKDKLKNIGLIKIDVEGMEFDVIEGANEIITNNRPLILFEQSDQDFDKNGDSKVIQKLKDLDYLFFYYERIWNQTNKIKKIFLIIYSIITGNKIRDIHILKKASKIPPRFYDMIVAVPKDIYNNQGISAQK